MKKETIKVDEVGGFNYNIYKYTIKGSGSGPTVYIQANVHGAEVQGNACIWRLVEKLTKTEGLEVLGNIIIVPQANPYGSSIKMGTYTYGRFNPVTGDNWNRMYLDFFKCKKGQGHIDVEAFVKKHLKSDTKLITSAFKEEIQSKLREYRASQELYSISDNKNVFVKLQELAAPADIVLDLHTAGVGTRYIYAAQYLKEESKALNSEFTIIIPNEFGGAMDEATFSPWIRLYDELKKHNINLDYKFESYTLELGGEEFISMEEANDDSENILSLLAERGIIKYVASTVKPQQHFCKLENYKMYRAPLSGLCNYNFAVGEAFKKGDILATIYRYDELENLEDSKTDIVAITDGYLINHTPSSNVKMGMDLMECFTILE